MNLASKFSFMLMTLAVCWFPECLTQYDSSADNFCHNIRVQLGIFVEKMTERWYVVEILDHLNTKKHYVDTCIKAEIKIVRENRLRFEWKEDDYTVSYNFDISNRSVWISQGAQTQHPDVSAYQQFAGTVSVLKASFDNAVLTFCSPNSKFYSLVLVRSLPVNRTQLDTIHKMFERFKLKILDKKEYCKNGSYNFKWNNSISVAFAIISITINYIYVK